MQLKDRLESVFLDISKKLDDPDLVQSISAFVESYENIQTDVELASALSSFGSCAHTLAAGCKRQMDYLQNSACLDEGQDLNIGLKPKILRQEEVCITTDGDINAPFHSITQCVEESMCLEGGH